MVITAAHDMEFMNSLNLLRRLAAPTGMSQAAIANRAAVACDHTAALICDRPDGPGFPLCGGWLKDRGGRPAGTGRGTAP